MFQDKKRSILLLLFFVMIDNPSHNPSAKEGKKPTYSSGNISGTDRWLNAQKGM